MQRRRADIVNDEYMLFSRLTSKGKLALKTSVKAAAIALMAFGTGAVSANAQDWSGLYGGLAAGTGNGTNTNWVGTFDISGSIAGLFVGYNFQNGNLVYGAELAASKAGIDIDTCGACDYNRFIDVKARVGWSSGKALYFGVLGYGVDTYEVAPDQSDGDGLLYGVGVDFMVSDKLFLGAEVLRRNLSHDPQGVFVAFDADITTVAARIGIRF